jgi:hypothetical protein
MAQQPAVLARLPVPDDRDEAGEGLGPVEGDQVGCGGGGHEGSDVGVWRRGEMGREIHAYEGTHPAARPASPAVRPAGESGPAATSKLVT